MELTATIKNALCDNFVDRLDGGYIVFVTSADAEVATLGFGTPAFGSAALGVATANAISSDNDAVGGTVYEARLEDSGNNELARCTVTLTGNGGEIIAASLIISAGQTVSITSFTVTVT